MSSRIKILPVLLLAALVTASPRLAHAQLFKGAPGLRVLQELVLGHLDLGEILLEKLQQELGLISTLWSVSEHGTVGSLNSATLKAAQVAGPGRAERAAPVILQARPIGER